VLISPKMGKKGVITIQFNWIYVIIIGGLILGLFIGIINKQRAVSEVAASGEMQRKLETLLVGAASSLGTANLLDIGRTEINVDCFGYSVGPVKPFDPGVSFSPSRIKVRGKQFITWAYPFNMPYLITNFLYVTSKQVRYVIVGDPDDDMLNKLRDTLPEELNIEFVESVQGLRYKNEDKTRFVFIGGLQSLDPSFNNADVSALEITDKLYFYKKPPTILSFTTPTGDYPNPGGANAVLYAAIFSEDLETFECNMEDAYDRVELINEIHIDRTRKLSTSSTYSYCSSYYNDAIGWFENLKINPMAAMELGRINYQLQIQSCPLLY